MIASAMVRVLLVTMLSDHLLTIEVRVTRLAYPSSRILGAVRPRLHHKCAPWNLFRARVKPQLRSHHVLYR